jgi:quercetin dioxygenase-like cupin family protein
MPAPQDISAKVLRWSGAQHPTLSGITRLMQKDNLQPYMWSNLPNHRYAVRSHNYDKVLYVVDGSLEIHLPDSNQILILRAGDRADIPAGVRHATIVGIKGAKCVEAALAGTKRR